uniref:Sigma-70 family RNA polymerase sigma factor n=1 Tax=Roseihalotalea indica TaxID=2867963 RepID=A0AA49GP52_9BACT|nr:sigma-70 family RNA polymerase sigma factor [Tunicatimonas sp. TK19036]
MREPSPPKVVQVVKDYGTRLFRFIRGRVRSDEDAEDILQEVWYQLSHSVNIDEIGQISGWLYRVARNKIVDKYRKKKPESLEDYDYGEEGEFSLKEILLADDSDPETEYLKELFWQELFMALEELPANQRLVFMENELENKTLQQIADETGEKLKTVISRKGYAVKHLRRRLETLYNEFISY